MVNVASEDEMKQSVILKIFLKLSDAVKKLVVIASAVV